VQTITAKLLIKIYVTWLEYVLWDPVPQKGLDCVPPPCSTREAQFGKCRWRIYGVYG